MIVSLSGQTPVPLWLEEPPQGEPPALIWTRPQTLPFDQLTSANFERLVLRLVRLDAEVEHAQQYGLPGEDQHGIDLYCRLRAAASSGRQYRSVQCRNVATATASELALAVEDFLEGSWARKSDIYVFAMRAGTIRSGRADAVEAAAERLRQANVRFELWDGEALSNQIRDLPDLVDQFFGPDAVRVFCTQKGGGLPSDNRLPRLVVGDVRTASARRLGVHQSIETENHMPGLPAYVYRTHDDQLRKLLVDEERRGELTVLVGGSSSGKTRSAFELIQREFLGWTLFHPASAEEVRTFSLAPIANCVVWLDELQRYIDSEAPLTASTLESLRRNAVGPLVVIATLWADRYQAYTALSTGGNDPYRTARELLRQAAIVDVAGELTSDEIRRANGAAAKDPRIRVALESTDYGMTQVLAAAPHLVRRWVSAPDPFSKALITAAIDAQTVGCQAPLSIALLRSVVPQYLQSLERARASVDWLEKALGYASQPLHGSASALAPVSEEMGHPNGYVVADYLVQYGGESRRGSSPPLEAWTGYVAHTQSGRSLLLIGLRAEQHGLQEIAESAFIKSEALGNADARYQLVKRTEETGRFSETEHYLRKGIAEGDPNALQRLTEFIETRRGTEAAIDFLQGQDRTNAGIADLLGRLLERIGRVDEAIAAWQAIDLTASILPGVRIAEILQRNGRLDEAADAWLQVAHAGAEHGWVRAASLLSKQGRLDELEQLRRDALAAGVPGALGRLVRLLQMRRKGNDVNTVLLRAASMGVRGAASWLAQLATDRGHQHAVEETLRAGMKAGDSGAQRDLILLLHRQGRDAEVKDIAARAVGNERHFQHWSSIDRLRRAGRVDDALAICQEAVAEGDHDLYWTLMSLLEEAGRAIEAISSLERSADGDPAVYRYIADIHQRLGDFPAAIKTLRMALAANHIHAWESLAWLLNEHGSSDELEQVLRMASGAGQRTATLWLAEHLIYENRPREVEPLFVCSRPAEQDHIILLFEEEGATSAIEQILARQISLGDQRARSQLSGIFERQSRLHEAVALWRDLAEHDQDARDQLADLLEEQGSIDGAAQVRKTTIELGDDDAYERASRFFVRHGRIDELLEILRSGVTRGVPGAQTQLAATLQRYGRHEEAAEVWKQAIEAGEPLARHLGALSGNRFDDRLTKPHTGPGNVLE